MFILPISIALIVRVWRNQGWELRGTWWGLLPIALSFAPLISLRNVALFWAAGNVRISLIPSVFPIYLYATGVVLLFAGVRVWRRAWFPLLLLLCIQPVPEFLVRVFDLPMQGIAARVARSFAYFLGLSPTNSELLRLMFTPAFGMFIAPGCDGMRGAITLGYGALIVGYLKRIPMLKWSACVVGAVALGHLFNLLRLCTLVLYYKVAIGHPELERVAKQADYVIGGGLFLVAALLFLWILLRAEKGVHRTDSDDLAKYAIQPGKRAQIYWKTGVFAVVVLAIAEPGVQAARRNSYSLTQQIQNGSVSIGALGSRIPAQAGAYRRVRVWQEEISGLPVLESAAFDAASSDEITIGIWLAPTDHSIRDSLMVHGESPELNERNGYATAGGQIVPFNTALYDDGITVTLIGDTHCSPSWCDTSLKGSEGIHLALTRVMDHASRGERAIPLFFKIQEPHSGKSAQATYAELSLKSKEFLSHINFSQLSRDFQ
jgi:exosortase J